MQKAMVSPLHKKNSTQDKENCRPVSILPILSKLYERTINAKLMDFFETKLHSSNGRHSGTIFFKPEKNLEFFRLKICARDAVPGKLE